MMDLIDIGKRIKGLRKDANLTQSKVAEFLVYLVTFDFYIDIPYH